MTDSEVNANIFYRTDESVPDDTDTIQSHNNNNNNDKEINVSESLFLDSTPYSELFGGNYNLNNGFKEYDSKLVQNLKTNFARAPLNQLNNQFNNQFNNRINQDRNDYFIKYSIPLSYGEVDTSQIKNKLYDMQRDIIDIDYFPQYSSTLKVGNKASASHSSKNKPNQNKSEDSHTYSSSSSSYSETSIQKSKDSTTQLTKPSNNSLNIHPESTNKNFILVGGKDKEIVLSSVSTHNTSSMFPIPVSTTDTSIRLPINYSESVPFNSYKSSNKTPSYILVSDDSYTKKKKKKKKKKKSGKKKRKGTPRPKKKAQGIDKDKSSRMYMY